MFEIELFANQTTFTYKYIRRFRYYEFFKEKISRRNVTHNVAICCHGYENVNGTCLSEHFANPLHMTPTQLINS